MKISKENILVSSLAILKLTIHLLTMHNYGLQRDAYLYYSLGEHLDWGFVSVPPFIGLVSWISTSVSGNTIFALRIFPALIGALSVFIIARLVKELKGSFTAVLIACIAFVLSPAFLRSNSLFQPVSFNQFFWLLSFYFLVRMINRKDASYWYRIMLLWAIAFLNKYSISFIILAILISLLMSRQRKLLFSKHFIISGFLAVLVIFPNLLWQYNHNWPVITHLAELQEYQFVHVTVKGYLIDQIFMNFPALIIWMSGLIMVLTSRRTKEYRLLGWTFLLTLLIILLFRGKSYYTLGLYTTLFALGGIAVDTYFKPRMKWIVMGLVVILFVPLAPISLSLMDYEKLERYTSRMAPIVNRWEDGEIHSIPQDFADMTGWEELAAMVIMKYRSLEEADRDRCMIFAENYGQAGAINFYGKKYGLPEVISFNDNFILWAPDSADMVPMIYVNHAPGDIDELFQEVNLVGTITNRFFREDGLNVYYCTNPREIFPGFYAGKVSEIKTRYRRE